MYIPPGRPPSPRVLAMIDREVRDRINTQLREEYGIDPEREVLILAVKMCDGSIEWRAEGATYPWRAELTRAGFRWDRKRGFWTNWPQGCYSFSRRPALEALANVPHVVKEAS